MMKENEKNLYISLKEASKILGYASDYIGFLIRKKKLKGKKIFSNPTWEIPIEELQKFQKKYKNLAKRDLSFFIKGNKKFLTLKEAAYFLGYAPDYIGSLIRKNKIDGIKIYSGTSWVTTIDTVKKYQKKKQRDKILKEKIFIPSKHLINKFKNFYYDFKIKKFAISFAVLLTIFLGSFVTSAVAPQLGTKIIEIYPSKIEGDIQQNSSEKSGLSWQNSQNVLGLPNIAPDGDFDNFSETNSSIYKNGPLSLLVSDFNKTQRDLLIPQDENVEVKTDELKNKENIEEQNNLEQEEKTQIEEQQTETNNQEENIQENVLGEDTEGETTENTETQTGTEQNTEEILQEENIENISNETTNETTEIETTNQQENLQENPTEAPAENSQENSEPSQENSQPPTNTIEDQAPEIQPSESQESSVSFWEKIKRFFVRKAIAEEVINYEELTKQKLISAKIKFSFAIGEKINDLVLPEVKNETPETKIPEQVSGETTENTETQTGTEQNTEEITNEEVVPTEELIPEQTQQETSQGVQSQTENTEEPQDTTEENQNLEENIQQPETSQQETQQQEVPTEIPAPVIPTEEAPSSFLDKIKNIFIGISKIIRPNIAKADEDNIETNNNVENPEPTPTTENTNKTLPNLDAKIIISYSLDNINWWELSVIDKYPLSNKLNEGYFEYEAPFLKNWDDVRNLKIKFEGVVGGETTTVFYLDSVWVEAEYEEAEQEEFELISEKDNWRADETPIFQVIPKKEKQNNIAGNLLAQVSSVFEKKPKVKAHIKENISDGEFSQLIENEDFKAETNSPTKITIFKPKNFKPGQIRFKNRI